MKNKHTEKKDLNYREILQNVFLILAIFSFIYVLQYVFSNLNLAKEIIYIMVIPILFLIPFLVMKLYDVKRIESNMNVVPRFLRDIVDNVESGMDLISAINSTVNNEYGVLNIVIQKLSNQLSWGVTFDEAMLNFADNIGSKSLKRDFRLIVEARKVGGHVEKLLRELSEKINTDNLRTRARKSNLSSNTFTGYISFIIFIVIIIIVYNSLFVDISSSFSGNSQMGSQTSGDDPLNIYLSLLVLLSYELAILSGFLFGLMENNNIISGAPHVVALSFITFVGFFFFI